MNGSTVAHLSTVELNDWLVRQVVLIDMISPLEKSPAD